MSVGFYPDRTYQACVGFGAARQAPVVLIPSFLHTLSVHLPTVCEYFSKQERHRCNELFFRLKILTGGFDPAAKFTMDHTSISLKDGELKYLLLNLLTYFRQLAIYKMAEKEVSACLHSSTA